MDFNNGNFFNNEPSRRDKLEIGNDGKTSAERKKERQREQQHNHMEFDGKGGKMGRGRGLKGRFGRGRGNNRGGNYNSRGSGGGASGVLLGLFLIAVPIILVVMLFSGNLTGVFRSVFSTPEQNQTAFYQGVYDMQQSNRDLSLTKQEQEQVAIYRKNEISRVEFIDEQVYPEYLVYVYSNSEAKNEAFNDFILEAEAYGFPVPIFRISADLTKNYFITDTAGENEPVFLIYKNVGGENQFDSMVNDPQHFDKLDPYMRDLIEQTDEYYQERVGEYKDSTIFQRIQGVGEQQEEQ